ncbi:hypothetical protein [Synechococcus elongatus]|uniref:hypothetical protein n=1 Tax=Synechococcus elongatus TaxID=32046 RepID=UPI000F7E0591|nr:hypothetical protein [Synechococcus elongatus]
MHPLSDTERISLGQLIFVVWESLRMNSLYVVKSDRSGQGSLSPELADTGNIALQNLSDLLQISDSLDLASLTAALKGHSSLTPSLLDAVNGLLMANYETAVIDNLLCVINGLISVNQTMLVQGLLNTVHRWLKENASPASLEDVITTVQASIHQLQAIGALAGNLPTYLFLMTAADTIDQSPETSAKKPSAVGKAFALRVLPSLH